PRPLVPARVEEPGAYSGERVDAGQVRPLVQVVVVARQRPVAGTVLAVVLAGNDVIDVESEERVVVLVQLAILASSPGAAADQFSQGVVHYEAASRRARGLA